MKTTPSEIPDNIIKGAVLLFVSVSMIATMNAVAKYLGDTHHPIEITFYRNIVILIGFSFWLWHTKQWHLTKTSNLGGQVYRSVVGTCGVVFAFWAVQKLPLAEATTILYAAPLFVTLLSYPLLGEKVGPFRSIAVLTGFGGIIVLAGPTGENLALAGILLALAASFFHGLTQIQLRRLGKTSNPLTTVFYFMLIGTIITGACMPFVYTQAPTINDYPLLLLLAGTGILQQLFKTVAYGLAPASVITPVNYTGLLWAILFGIVIWDDIPGPAVYVGAVIIILSNLVILWREHKLKIHGQSRQ